MDFNDSLIQHVETFLSALQRHNERRAASATSAPLHGSQPADSMHEVPSLTHGIKQLIKQQASAGPVKPIDQLTEEDQRKSCQAKELS